MNLERILKFNEFLFKFQEVVRCLYVKGKDRDENDMEHSYQLAMMAWYIVDSNKLDLDIDLVLKYSLVHDLVEAYAGDAFFYAENGDHFQTKEHLEKEAFLRIKKEFSEFVELGDCIEKYESKSDQESKFVYALDKVMPVLNIYMDGGRSWRRDDVTLEMLESKTAKISKDENVLKVWEELISLIKKEKDNLFN